MNLAAGHSRLKNMDRWVSLTLINLALVALFGVFLRTKFLFHLPFIDYKNLLSAHSHFAFGGWATMSLMILFVDKLLNPADKQKGIYQLILGGIQTTSLGMMFTFPFQGYALFSIIFSTSYIFITYIFCWVFIRDLLKTGRDRPVKALGTCSLISLAVSSIGPFYLAYMMATKTGTYFQTLDAVYTFLHFQYNGFFTLGVLALFFDDKYGMSGEKVKDKIGLFVTLICLSIVPALFLSLLWHSYNINYLRTLAYIGCALILLAIIAFSRLIPGMLKQLGPRHKISRTLLIFALVSFVIKMVMQTGTIFPALGNAVFGFRPIIIGFLHLVFLGLITFYILSRYIDDGFLSMGNRYTKFAVIYFSTAIIVHEVILLVNGVGLLMKKTDPIYGWLMWIAALTLFTSAILMVIGRYKQRPTGMIN